MNKKLLSAFLFLVAGCVSIQAQTSYSYYFNHNLHGTNGAPDLIPQCPGSVSYGTHDFSSIGGGVRPVFNINPNCGLLFSDGGGFLRKGSYTIEMYMMMYNVIGYRKLIDYKNLRTDDGLISLGGELGFNGTSALSIYNVYTDSVYFHVLITRDSASRVVNMYSNGALQASFQDTTALAVYDAHKFLYFLTDDSVTGTQSITGQIEMLRIFGYAMDSAAVVQQSSHSSVLSVQGPEAESGLVSVYPNPASALLHIASPSHSSQVEIYSIDGRMVDQATTDSSADISIALLPAGMYLVRVTADGATSYHKVLKQ
jgi:hypothetical protein